MKGRIATGALAAALTIAGALVAKWEPAAGDAMYVAHRDPVGVWEICYGHTPGVTPGMTATPDQCEAWLIEDLRVANAAIDRCITHPLTANQRGALLSGVYNLGPQLVCGSTLQRKANAGDMEGACLELTHARNKRGEEKGWAYAAGVWFRGLWNRRADERAICWPNFGNVRAGVATTAGNL